MSASAVMVVDGYVVCIVGYQSLVCLFRMFWWYVVEYGDVAASRSVARVQYACNVVNPCFAGLMQFQTKAQLGGDR